jgi:signal transduction histidine kinase
MAKSELELIRERIREKQESYARYNFERPQEEAFAIFFDLAQEYTGLDTLYLVCTLVPKEVFNLDARLHLLANDSHGLRVVCSSNEGLQKGMVSSPTEVTLTEQPYFAGDSYIIPVRGNKAVADLLPMRQFKHIMGMFELFPSERISEQERFFLEKFTNRIGYNLHQKQLIHQTLHHIKFINQLVADIEHNVISPNIYYRLFFKKLRRGIDENQKNKEMVRELVSFCQELDDRSCRKLRDIFHSLEETTGALAAACDEIERHYEHTSLYLETLLRRDHFRRGSYVLRKQRCNFKKEIIEPVLARYLPRFNEKGIVVDNRLEEVPDEELELLVDKGLLAQVYDNFFSNAEKYTQQIVDEYGYAVKFVSYGKRLLEAYFGKGIDGIKFSVFTTGTPILPEEAARLFEEGYRRPGSDLEAGTGHGLHFVRTVIEIHGGVVGVEPQKYGNSIFFILPHRTNHTPPMVEV